MLLTLDCLELHLKQYHDMERDYLGALERTAKAQKDAKGKVPIQTIIPFSEPADPFGYNLTSISGDMVTEVYKHFGECRKVESTNFIKTLSGKLARLSP